jgi:hypothetical protein
MRIRIYKVMNTDFVGSIDVSVCELYMILSKYIHRSKAFFFLSHIFAFELFS